jgi:hypothetical protein
MITRAEITRFLDARRRYQSPHHLNSEIYEIIRDGNINELRNRLNRTRRRQLQFSIRFNKARTLLHVATYFNQIDIAEMLISVYCLKDDVKDADGRLALHVAAKKGYYECARRIINPESINAKDRYLVTPLLESYMNGHERITEYLLSFGADYTHTSPWLRDLNGIPISIPLIYAATHATFGLIDEVSSTPPSASYASDDEIGIIPLNEFIRRVSEHENTVVPLEATVPVHVQNEFIEMAILLKKTCPVCLECFQTDHTVFTKCSHVLCSGCFKNDKLLTCPLCRTDIK